MQGLSAPVINVPHSHTLRMCTAAHFPPATPPALRGTCVEKLQEKQETHEAVWLWVEGKNNHDQSNLLVFRLTFTGNGGCHEDFGFKL